jgi:hypothetical protein
VIGVGQPRGPLPVGAVAGLAYASVRSLAAVGRGGAEAGMRIPVTPRKKTFLNFERRVPTVFSFNGATVFTLLIERKKLELTNPSWRSQTKAACMLLSGQVNCS